MLKLLKLIFGSKDGHLQMVDKVTDPVAADAQILEQLVRLGANLSEPRDVRHYLYLPTEEAAEHAASELRNEGYQVEARPSADAASNPPNPWLVLATKDAIVNSETVAAARDRFGQLASEGNGEYDGWEAAAKP